MFFRFAWITCHIIQNHLKNNNNNIKCSRYTFQSECAKSYWGKNWKHKKIIIISDILTKLSDKDHWRRKPFFSLQGLNVISGRMAQITSSRFASTDTLEEISLFFYFKRKKKYLFCLWVIKQFNSYSLSLLNIVISNTIGQFCSFFYR